MQQSPDGVTRVKGQTINQRTSIEGYPNYSKATIHEFHDSGPFREPGREKLTRFSQDPKVGVKCRG